MMLHYNGNIKINGTNTLLTKLSNELNRPVKCSQGKYEVSYNFLMELFLKS